MQTNDVVATTHDLHALLVAIKALNADCSHETPSTTSIAQLASIGMAKIEKFWG